MQVVDHQPYTWFLFELNGELFLDVNCNHSAVGYSILIRLDEVEVAEYRRLGRSALDVLAQSVHEGGPGSELQRRDITEQFREETRRAIEEWRRRGGWDWADDT